MEEGVMGSSPAWRLSVFPTRNMCHNVFPIFASKASIDIQFALSLHK